MLEKIKEILVEQLNCDADSINEDTSFKDDLGADSLDLYEMVMALEDEYGIEIDTDELTDLSTVGDFMEYLKQHGVERSEKEHCRWQKWKDGAARKKRRAVFHSK